MVKLFCVIDGVAESSFPVDIDADQTVGDLKKVIKGEKPNDLKDVDAKNLQLFLAKKDEGRGAWLTEADVKKADGLTPLDAGGAPLNLVGLSKKDVKFQVTRQHVMAKTTPVHVLVVVPEGAGGSVSEASKMDQVVQEVHEIHAQTVLTKRKTYTHSKVGSTEYEELLDAFNITVKPVRKTVAKWGKVKGFTWDMKLSEEKQKDEYREYVDSNIGEVLQEKKLCVFGVENVTDILRVVVKGSNIELRGRTDLLILSDIVMESADYALDLPEVKMLIEVKEKVERQSVFQATSELIALDLLANDPVVALLTDFNGDWRFFWVAGKENNTTCINRVNITNPGEAFELIRQLLKPTDTTDLMTPVLQDPMKRQKLSRVLPSISEASESGGIRESIERYYDIASILGPDMDMARAVARQVTRSIPTLSYFS
ncbi:Crinkler effector protein 63 [Phytophthora ramorum]|uniref:Crinkler effector protein N-terminal domain-containing protein n=1 Tax=Phytophthora ramorum TaxID=164328 RepID=H3GA83_PHYRM|nr:Crinkler effector protein 63 [Phytophthora ramorum]